VNILKLERTIKAYKGVMKGLADGNWSEFVQHPAIPSDIGNPENPKKAAIRLINQRFDRYLREIGFTPDAIPVRTTS